MPIDLAQFEWDERKAALNLLKHGVKFEWAAESFFDDQFIMFPDEKHSANERRWIGIGRDENLSILTTVFTFRAHRIRIISSRIANKRERNDYEPAKK